MVKNSKKFEHTPDGKVYFFEANKFLREAKKEASA